MIRHVWCRPAKGPREHPGLILEWQLREPDVWYAQVCYVDHRDQVVIEWLPSDQVRPIEVMTNIDVE